MENNKKLNHIAVILDGNRRFAKAKGLPGHKGHTEGAEKLEEFLEWTKEKNIKESTFYTLSTENLNRDQEELKHLFNLFRKFFKKFKDNKQIHEDKVKISFIGDLSLVPKDIQELAKEIQEDTKDYDNYKLNFCFAYGGRLELTNAINTLLEQGKKSISEEEITEALWLSSEPDLIIRTGGKVRTSNFLPWQSVYSEWVFLEKMWPEFTKQDLEKAIKHFEDIQRNFGK